MDEKSRNSLWEEYMRTRSPQIRGQLIIEYSGLVKIVAGRLGMYLGYTVEYDDLVGYGIFGLIDAIDKFELTKGVKFETYASLRIRGSILDQIRKMDWIPRTLRQKQKKLDQAMHDFEAKHGRVATNEELSKELDIPATLSANNTGKVYATTAVATTALSEDKSDSNLKNKYFVTAYGTIYWRDNVGPDNEFLGASGGWDRDRDPDTGFLPALSNAKVDMQGQHGAGTYVHKLFYPTTYQFNIDKSQFNYVKYSFWFDSTITVDGSNTLSLHVSTGLLT